MFTITYTELDKIVAGTSEFKNKQYHFCFIFNIYMICLIVSHRFDVLVNGAVFFD